jgi:urate oxidase
MSVVLIHHAYGKSRVRLTKVERHADRHDLFEWVIGVRLAGDFAVAYTAGDNRQVIATDTMKNVVYALAADADLGSPETFGLALGRQFLKYEQVTTATLHIEVEPWSRAEVGGRPHPHTFVGGGGGRRTCTVTASRDRERVTAGLADLLVLKTTDSAWRDFHKDEYRTLPDAADRILATSLTAEWTYTRIADWDASWAAARQALVETFARHKSLGAQHTLHAMGEAVLAAVPEADEITLTMPNRHRILMNLQPLGRNNPDAVFVATDEPHGVITGTLRRSSDG